MKFLKELLSENGTISTMRLMSIIALIVGAILAMYGLYEGRDLAGVAQLSAVFVGSAFAAKFTQKLIETPKKDVSE